MRQRSMLLGNLAAYRELPVQEQERLARSPQARQLLAAFGGQDVLLAALPEPPIPARATTRIWAATVGAPSAVHERSAGVARPVATLRVWVVAMAALIVLASLGITGYAAAGSLPGDPLYGIKRLEERLHLTLTFGEEQRGAYQQRLQARRRAEVQALLAERRTGVAVAFTGDLDQATDGRWRVAGVAVALPAEQVALAGEHVSVEGVTADGQVQVRAMTNRGPRSPLPTPQPPTPGAHPTSTLPTSTAELTATLAAPTPEPTTGRRPMDSPPPTTEPTGTAAPTMRPTGGPRATAQPTRGPRPTTEPTGIPQPTTEPSGTRLPTSEPAGGPRPTTQPTGEQRATTQPTGGSQPTTKPTSELRPTAQPTGGPQRPTAQPGGGEVPDARAQRPGSVRPGNQPMFDASAYGFQTSHALPPNAGPGLSVTSRAASPQA